MSVQSSNRSRPAGHNLVFYATAAGTFLAAAIVAAAAPAHPAAESTCNRQSAEIVIQTGHPDPVRSVEFSGDGKLVATASNFQVGIWDTQTGIKTRSIELPAILVCAAFSPDGKTMATELLDDTIVIWDSHSGRKLRIVSAVKQASRGEGVGVLFTPDGKGLLGPGPSGMTISDVNNGQTLVTFADVVVGGTCAAFSPDGNLVAVGGVVFDAHSGKRLHALGVAGVRSLAFSDDGKRLFASAKGGFAWDTATWKRYTLYTLPQTRHGVVYSSSRSFGVIPPTKGGDDVLLWDPDTGDRRLDLPGGPGGYFDVSFSGDGRIAFARDRLAIIGRVQSGRMLHTLAGHADSITCMSFSADGKLFATGSLDCAVVLWDCANRKEALFPRGARLKRYRCGLQPRREELRDRSAGRRDGGLEDGTGSESSFAQEACGPSRAAARPPRAGGRYGDRVQSERPRDVDGFRGL